MMGTCGICCWKLTIRAAAPWLKKQHSGKKQKRKRIFNAGLKMLHSCIKFKLKFLFCKCLLIRHQEKIKSKRDGKAAVGSKAVCLEVKHLHRPQRETDGCITPVHFSSNSLLHWRKTGHFYCQRTREIWRWARERERRRERRAAWTEGRLEGGERRGPGTRVEPRNSPIDSATAVWL